MGADFIEKLGFSTACLANHGLERAAQIGRELGFSAIELLTFDGYRHSQGRLAGFYFDRLSSADKNPLLRLVAPFKHVSTHAPFIDIPLFAPNPGIREEAFRQIVVAIEATAFLWRVDSDRSRVPQDRLRVGGVSAGGGRHFPYFGRSSRRKRRDAHH